MSAMLSLILGGSLILSFVFYGSIYSFAAAQPKSFDESTRVRLWLKKKYQNDDQRRDSTSNNKLKERIQRFMLKFKSKPKL